MSVSNGYKMLFLIGGNKTWMEAQTDPGSGYFVVFIARFCVKGVFLPEYNHPSTSGECTILPELGDILYQPGGGSSSI